MGKEALCMFVCMCVFGIQTTNVSNATSLAPPFPRNATDETHQEGQTREREGGNTVAMRGGGGLAI